MKHSWGRHESQNRASLHAHIAIWLEKPRSCKVRATIPRADSTTVDGLALREKIMRWQTHSCDGRPCKQGRWAEREKSQYGLPADLRARDEVVDGRWEYRRVMEEDRRISPYHPLLSLAWGGHVNIQLVGDNDLVMYLCKYHAKASPAKYIKLTDDVLVDLGMGLGNELQRMICEHFLSIVISVPEAVMVLLGLNFVHFYSTTHSDPLRLPVILPHQQGQIFVRGQATDDLITVYGCRPVGPEFDNPTFVEYHTQYARSRQAKVREEEEEGRG